MMLQKNFLIGFFVVCFNNEKMKLVNDKVVICVYDADCGEVLWSCQGGYCCFRLVNIGVWLGLNISLYYRFRQLQKIQLQINFKLLQFRVNQFENG